MSAAARATDLRVLGLPLQGGQPLLGSCALLCCALDLCGRRGEPLLGRLCRGLRGGNLLLQCSQPLLRVGLLRRQTLGLRPRLRELGLCLLDRLLRRA